jgi:hypothetical protein
MKEREIIAAHHRVFCRPGSRFGALRIESHDGIHGRVDLLDPLQAAVEQLDRRQGLAADQPAGVGGGKITGFGQEDSSARDKGALCRCLQRDIAPRQSRPTPRIQ